MAAAVSLKASQYVPFHLRFSLLCQTSKEPSQWTGPARSRSWNRLLLKKRARMGIVKERRRARVSDGNSVVTEYLVQGFGWGVRRMLEDVDEMRKVADVQAEAFHSPVAIFNDFFLEIFRADVFSAVLYRIRNSLPDRYACLVAESIEDVAVELAGVVDCTVQRDEDVLRHLQGAEEYLYVSGIAVRTRFRRRKVATVLLRACDALSRLWGHRHVVLRAYEDDFAARGLYSQEGYVVVSRDPFWVSWLGRKRRLLMIKLTHSL
ncbi:hypothetical protein HPP92_002765 [Vanilla planifolia]|uniref:N-acetyltransferase domain-containing protein n=1 Tax=Vanilla planifolia TaxID=51239 RepID=A0A835RYR6_VANPL|nr:hypothetical protein HPP92_002765 [Vanilla planifolia]